MQRLGGLRLIRRVFAAFRLLQLLFELVLGRHGAASAGCHTGQPSKSVMKRRTASIPLERGLWCFSGGRDFGEGLTHTGDGAVMQLRRELHAACGKQVDHRGAEFEAAHLGAFSSAMAPSSPAAG